MAQRSQMFYAYFRFYSDESQIETGLEQFCTDWEHMFAVGYNYHEYKCFVDNIGGFEHWVGDMRGYISQTRETGFFDGAPSDGVFDQTMTMGSKRVICDEIIMLDGFKPNSIFLFRKISAQDVGIANKVEFKFSIDQKIIHPVMYTLDNQQIEKIKQSDVKITNNSTVDSYEYMVDINVTPNILTLITNSDLTITDPNHFDDNDYDTFMKLDCVSGDPDGYLIYETTPFTNIAIKVKSYVWGSGIDSNVKVYHSNDNVAWTSFGSTNSSGGTETRYFSDVGITAKYVKILIDKNADGNTGRGDIYEVICS